MRKLIENKIIQNVLYSAFALFFMWAGWIIAYRAIANDYLFPSVGDAFSSCFALLRSGSFYAAFGNTLLRTLVSFAVSFLCALVFSVASYMIAAVRGVLKPIMAVIRTVPTMAVILLLLIWTNPKTAPVIVTALVSFPMLYASFLSSLDAVDPDLKQMSRVYCLSFKDKIFSMYLPLSAPYVFGEAGSQFSFALKVMVSAEVLSKTYRSIGGMMSEAKMYVEISELLALTMLVVLAGAILEIFCFALKKAIVRWK